MPTDMPNGPRSGASIAVRDLKVAYGGTRVLHGVSLDFEPGSFTALLGSSGCGKTTLLRALSGFVPVESGAILVGGQDVAPLPPEKRGMAMVFQSYALWPHMTVLQNMGYGLKLRGVPKAQIAAKVGALLAMLGLSGYEDRKVTALSGGQRQRVALGRALAIDPGILLLDEPLSNLDAKIRMVMRHEIRAIQQRLGLTAVHVTHDREEAMTMADRLVIMQAGRVAQVGTPEEVYDRPASAFVANFVLASYAGAAMGWYPAGSSAGWRVAHSRMWVSSSRFTPSPPVPRRTVGARIRARRPRRPERFRPGIRVHAQRRAPVAPAGRRVFRPWRE